MTLTNNFMANLKDDWNDGTYTYRDIGEDNHGVNVTYWDSEPFNVYDTQYKDKILCTVHGINFYGYYQCLETGYIYGLVSTIGDEYYDLFDFRGYGWVDPRDFERIIISY